jgi:hypothetical protein
MTESYAPYLPLNRLKPFGPDIWIVDGPEIEFHYLGMKLPFPTRMTVVRFPDRTLWVHSPTEPEEGLLDEIRSLGNVRHLIAPNTIHYWWVPDWAELFPEAQVWAVPGLAKSAKRKIRIDHTLGETAPAAWENHIEQVLVPGDIITEADFFHHASRTLVLTDLIENFEPERVRSKVYRWLLKTFGAADPDGKAPYDMQLSFLRHRKDVRAAVEQMIAWAPEQIVIAHGRCYDMDAVNELKRAFRWVL